MKPAIAGHCPKCGRRGKFTKDYPISCKKEEAQLAIGEPYRNYHILYDCQNKECDIEWFYYEYYAVITKHEVFFSEPTKDSILTHTPEAIAIENWPRALEVLQELQCCIGRADAYKDIGAVLDMGVVRVFLEFIGELPGENHSCVFCKNLAEIGEL